MLRSVPMLRFGVLVVLLVGAATLADAAAAIAKPVVSDVVVFKGGVNSAGGFSASKCTVKSDGEATVFPCQLNGQAFGIGGPTIEVNSTWVSGDGEDFFLPFAVPRTVSKPPLETYEGTGPCVERENEAGATFEYPCKVTVKLVFNLAKHTVTGRYVVREESTEP